MRQKEKKEQELEEKLCPGYALFLLFLVWPVVASKNNAFIWDFLSFYGNKGCPKLESDQWPGMTSQTALYPDYFKWSCCSVLFWKSARYFRSFKIYRKLGFQPNEKMFAAFLLIPYRNCTKWKTFFGVIGTLKHIETLIETSSIGYIQGSRDGAVVRALASHHFGPGSIPGPGVTCALSLLLVLVPALMVFLRVLRFSSLHEKPTLQILIRSENEGHRFVSFAVKCYPH